MLQQRNLTAADFGGPALEGVTRRWYGRGRMWCWIFTGNILRPGRTLLRRILRQHTGVLAEYGLAEEAYELSKRAAELARQAADEFAKPGRPRFVGGSMGPTTKAITVTVA